MPLPRRAARPAWSVLLGALIIATVACSSRSTTAPLTGSAPTDAPAPASPVAPAAVAGPATTVRTPTVRTSPDGPSAVGPTSTMLEATMSETTIPYGADPSQFGVLYLPGGPAPSSGLPVVVLIHGGFWRASYGLDLMVPLAEDLVARGFAVWNIEYRRVGQPGGGWPGTLEDAAAAIDQLATIAGSAPLDLARVAVVGHSAGGHLALWAAGRGSIPAGSPGAAPKVVPVLAIGQGPVVDLVAGDRDQLGGGAVTDLLGGTSREHPDRYALATPSTSTTARLVVVRGEDDTTVPAEYTLPAEHAAVHVIDEPGEDHFDLIDPRSAAWAAVVAELARI